MEPEGTPSLPQQPGSLDSESVVSADSADSDSDSDSESGESESESESAAGRG